MSNNFFSRNENSKDDWETPPAFFKLLDDKFHFTLDACASPSNAKCKKYYTIEQNGLIQDWTGETVFINPPFSDNESWLRKALEESEKGITVVVIIPARTDTKYWHNYAMKSDEIWLCQGRVNFLINGKKPKNGSTFPLAVIVFRKKKEGKKFPSIITLITH